MQPTQFGLRLARLQDVLGVCRFVFSRRFRGDDEPDLSDLSAPGFSNGIEVLARTGKDERFVVPAEDVRRLLRILFARVPWAMSGFDDDSEKLWKMNRQQLADGIQTNRLQIQALSPEACQALVDQKVAEAEEKIRLIRDHDPRKS